MLWFVLLFFCEKKFETIFPCKVLLSITSAFYPLEEFTLTAYME